MHVIFYRFQGQLIVTIYKFTWKKIIYSKSYILELITVIESN